MPHWAIGIDIGGTKIAGAVVSSQADVRERRTIPTPSSKGGTRVLEAVAALATDLARSSLPRGDRLRAIGVGTGGQVEAATGRLVGATATIPQWAGIDLRGALQEATGLPVYVDNDAKAMARAELYAGAARGARTAIFLTLGTGVGGALAVHGRVVHGARGLAGHLGHIRADEGQADPPLCSCGRTGCLEAYASGPAIRSAGIAALSRNASSGCPIEADRAGDALESTVPNASAVWEAYRRGEPWAASVIARARRALAVVLAGLVYSLNPDTVVLGGGLSSWGEPWCQEIEHELRSLVDPVFLDRMVLVPAALGSGAGTVGAALLAFEGLGDSSDPR